MTDGTSAPDSASNGAPSFELWKQHEEVAMHFNDLLIKLRMQALGGVAAISAVSAALLKEAEGGLKWEAIAALMAGMALLWIAVFMLDVFYYHKLLRGSVVAIVALEAATRGSGAAEIHLSTLIEAEFKPKRFFPGVRECLRTKLAPIGVLAFYGITLVVLLFLAGVATYCWFHPAASDTKAPAPLQDSTNYLLSLQRADGSSSSLSLQAVPQPTTMAPGSSTRPQLPPQVSSTSAQTQEPSSASQQQTAPSVPSRLQDTVVPQQRPPSSPAQRAEPPSQSPASAQPLQPQAQPTR